MKSPIVTLNEFEVDLAKRMAKARHKSARVNNVFNDRKASNMSDDDVDLTGALAELCFCKLCNLYPAFSLGGDDKGVDCILTKKVDVKGTKYSTGNLIVKGSKKNDTTEETERYVLMTGVMPTFTYRGWKSKRDVFQEKYLRRNKDKGDSYWVPQEDLHWIIPGVFDEEQS